MTDKRGGNSSLDSLSREADAMLKEAKKLQKSSNAKTSDYQDKKSSFEDPHNLISESIESISIVARFITSSKDVIIGLHEKITAPVLSWVKPPIVWILGRYKQIWSRHAYKIDKATGERKISRARSTLLVIFTILFLSIFTNTWLGDSVRFFTIEPVVDGVLISLSKRTEVFYLNNSEEIDSVNNIHAVRGCRSSGVCSEKDAAYFRVRPRLSHDIWKLIEYGNPVYVPDHVVAPIAPGVNKCDVTYYGYRMTSSWISRVIRALQIYPTMLEASCEFLGGTNAQE